MTVTPSSPIVGIFRDRSMAEQAIDALYNAGFTSEQIRYSAPGTSGSILADLKNLFTGQNAGGGNIASELTSMGLSDEEAQYYADEYKNGNTILAVSPSSREQEALNILHLHGAYNAHTSDSPAEITDPQQPSDSTQQAVYTPDSTQQAVYTPDSTQQAVYTPDETSPQQHSTPAWATQEQPSDAENHPFQNAQQDIVAPTPDTETQRYPSDEDPTAPDTGRQPTEPLVPVYRSTSQDPSLYDAGTLEATSDSQNTPSTLTDTDTYPQYQAFDAVVAEPQNAQTDAAASDAAITDSVAEPQDAQPELTDSVAEPQDTQPELTDSVAEPQDTQPELTDSVAEPQDTQTELTDSVAEPQDTQTNVASSNGTAPDSTAAFQNTPIATTSSEYDDELQQLQAQLQSTQQQLQDARAQLQAAKEHEAQIQTIQTRKRQLQEARQQLQDIQAQLQDTLAQLQTTKERTSQYQ
jgi:hypothetical protein